jgi:intraflagellar transport protein 172
MHLKYLRSIIPPSEGFIKITSVCYSPNSMRLAAVSSNKTVYLYDENGEQKDKFSTKAADGKVRLFSSLH